MSKIAILDYGMGNLRSVQKAFEHVAPDQEIIVTGDAGVVKAADRVVFPGQGAIGGCMRLLDESGLRDALMDAMKNKPFLGICLGLQALFEHSEEGGGVDMLGVIPGNVRHFGGLGLVMNGLKIPHMGWNQVHRTQRHPLWRKIDQNDWFYFVHSYYVDADNDSDIAGITRYGEDFVSAAGRDNVFAVQFHPEKSQHAGLQLLKNFTLWDGGSQLG
ncbi:MAG: imidazole glycerol phosphate synthase subunit HisH [Gammaproteobacteria bacterium]|nr:MAG: imidazole glycerol phosphate synthase subunit HisH [Gammaproteobacteria bacterium]